MDTKQKSTLASEIVFFIVWKLFETSDEAERNRAIYNFGMEITITVSQIN